MKRITSCVLLFVPFMVALAAPTTTTYNWTSVGATSTGRFDDSARWGLSSGHPDLLGLALFNVNASYVVTMPPGYFEARASFEQRVYSGRQITNDWRGTEWAPAACAAENYTATPFSLQYSSANNAWLFAYETASGDTARFTRMPFRIKDGFFNLSAGCLATIKKVWRERGRVYVGPRP